MPEKNSQISNSNEYSLELWWVKKNLNMGYKSRRSQWHEHHSCQPRTGDQWHRLTQTAVIFYSPVQIGQLHEWKLNKIQCTNFLVRRVKTRKIDDLHRERYCSAILPKVLHSRSKSFFMKSSYFPTLYKQLEKNINKSGFPSLNI